MRNAALAPRKSYSLRSIVDGGNSLERVEELHRWALVSDEVLADYRQLWRLGAPRYSDVCKSHEERPITQAVYDELVRMARVLGYEPTRWYHVVVVHEKTGKKAYMTATPVTHKQGCTILSKIPDWPSQRKQLEEVD